MYYIDLSTSEWDSKFVTNTTCKTEEKNFPELIAK